MNRQAPTTETRAACQEAQEVLLFGTAPAETTARARVDRHLGHCAACQAMRRSLDQRRAHVAAAARPLDDVHRARLLARLAPALDEEAARAATAQRRPAWHPWVVPAAALMAAGAAAMVVASLRHRPPAASAPATLASAPTTLASRRAPATGFAAPPTTPAAPAIRAPHAAAPPLIVPYQIVAGRMPRTHLIDQHFSRLQTAAGTTVRARVGERTRVTMVGPADVSVAAATDDLLDVNLDAGTLVADFIHRRNGRLRIHSPGAVTEVVGTLFSVEVRGQQSRVSVAHGRVVVQPPDGPPRVVSSGQSWTTGTPTVRALPPGTAALLADHGAAIAVREAPPRSSTSAPAIAAVLPAEEPSPIETAAPTEPPAQPKPTPISAAPAAPRATPSPPPAPDAVYGQAEAAMRRRDWPSAARALERVAGQATAGPLGDQARYELAQLAIRAGDPDGAARWLDALLASDREAALRQPAAFLRCDLRARSGSAADARRCWEQFRGRFPGSSRDAQALGWLLRLDPSAPCATLRPLADEYLQRYPSGADVARARQQRARCGP